MKVKFACPNCGKPHSVDGSLAGKKGRCQQCGTVMRIPGAPRAVAASGSPASRPAPVADPVDPFGFDDEPSPAAAGPLPPRGGLSASTEDEGGVLPGRIKTKSGKSKSKRKRAGDGPWNLPLRGLAVNLIVLSLLGSFIRTGLASAMGASSFVSTITWINVGLAVLAMALTVASVVGAAISFFGGNRRAFSGESLGGQLAWGWAIFQSALVLAAFGVTYQYGGAFGLATMGKRLSTTPRENLETYDRLFESSIGTLDEMSRLIMTAPEPGTPEYDAHFQAFVGLMAQAQNNAAQYISTPLPTRDQAEFLRTRYHLPLVQALRSAADSMRVMANKIGPLATTPEQRTSVDASLKWADSTKTMVDTLDKFFVGDVTKWYLYATTPRAGEGAGAAPVPGQPPEHVLRQIREAEERSRAPMNGGPGGPSFGPGGPSFEPGGPGAPPFGPGGPPFGPGGPGGPPFGPG
ncbi:hypothetical protein [Planctomyces sp. SH-PL62]|uniref:hypothetical protein n=1 Tax=Planctomyces sp. SH-PL62 TaxID=1636152 RepID=UPI00078B273B|nr:hypothetical protein [Planctomyces sp. SH-PL62]AMV36437.1 hypothetical protein VT85_03330 [Planctomyces sp. SH-PL62]